MINSFQDEGTLVWSYWVEIAWFTFFQKFATFLLGYLLVFYYMYHRYQLDHMEGKISTIREVKNSYRDLYEDLKEQSIQEETSVLYVKVGNKIKVVPVSRIEWIQSDDYCVRVHVDEHEYVLRKSMKAMEGMLPDNFIRVHRQAIVNTDYMKELVFNGRNLIILNDGTQVAIAKSRITEIRKVIKTM
jgi:DNA-binding LytR/AlgR family response regulator